MDCDCKRDSLWANGLVCAQAEDGYPILPRCELLPRVLMAAMDAIVNSKFLLSARASALGRFATASQNLCGNEGLNDLWQVVLLTRSAVERVSRLMVTRSWSVVGGLDLYV